MSSQIIITFERTEVPFWKKSSYGKMLSTKKELNMGQAEYCELLSWKFKILEKLYYFKTIN